MKHSDLEIVIDADDTTIQGRAKPVRGIDAIHAIYGPPGLRRCSAGIVSLPVPVGSITEVRCHELVERQFQAFVDALFAQFPPLVRTISGYEPRVRRGAHPRSATRMSLTGWGIALEINSGYNHFGIRTHTAPYGQPEEVTQRGEPGFAFYLGHPIVDLAREHGFAWLGGTHWPSGAPITQPDPAMFAYVLEY